MMSKPSEHMFPKMTPCEADCTLDRCKLTAGAWIIMDDSGVTDGRSKISGESMKRALFLGESEI